MIFEVDTDKIESILKNDAPISMGEFVNDNTGNTKLLVVFALPEIEPALTKFVENILNTTKNTGK